jgi:hypothetical protein
LFSRRQITPEGFGRIGLQPDPAAGDFDMIEDVRLRELLLLFLRRFRLVRA